MKNLFKPGRAVLALATLLAPTLTYGQTGTLDPSFGIGGKAPTDLSGAIAVQADGKLVVAGAFPTGDGSSNFALERYFSNGALDTSFGTGGKITTDFGGRFQRATSVALQPDGKIVAAGGSVINQYNEFALARYDSNGALDTSFGSGGKVTTDIDGVSAQAYSVAVQADGKILVAGQANIDGGNNFELVRYNSNGTLDASFGTGGKVTTDFGLIEQGFSVAMAYSLALQQDGKIVLAGQAFIGAGNDFALARYNSNGTLDTSFGTGGKVTTDFGTDNDMARSIAVQADGKIVTVGLARNRFAVARYNIWGMLDTSFGMGGEVISSIAGLSDQGSLVALQGDGKIVVGGRSFINGAFHSALARYTVSGTLDTTFGTAGKLTAIFGGDSDGVSSMAVQPDGKIVLSGGSSAGGTSVSGLARFN